MQYEDIIQTKDGKPVLTTESAEKLRHVRSDKTVIAQRGCQEMFLASNADITIFGGNRGGGKSFALLMEVLRDIKSKYSNSVIIRKEKDDLRDIINTSLQLYAPFGYYNRSINDMTWNFQNGGKLWFSYYSDNLDDFKARFQGKQFSYIGIDEITQCSYPKFKYLITCNRNAHNLRNRFYGTCNPDSSSWVMRFIQWWLDMDNEGRPIPERNGVIRYCFMDGETPDSIYWGDTPQEVYEQCKHIIDPLWKPEYEALGFDKVSMFVKSVTFILGRLEENVRLLESDPAYLANLAQQSSSQRMRDLEGLWKPHESGDDRITVEEMEAFLDGAPDKSDRTRYISADIAFNGGDFCVMWLWEGHHIQDLYVTQGSSAEVESRFVAKVDEWGVREENVVFDFWGVGQAIAGHVSKAVKFTGTQKPREPYDKSFKNVKSQCADMLIHQIQAGTLSIEPRLLSLRFSGGRYGKYANSTLRDILMQERKCLRHKDNSSVGGFDLISKEAMIKLIGHSPDFIESLLYRMWFDIGRTRKPTPRGMASYSDRTGGASAMQHVRKIKFI